MNNYQVTQFQKGFWGIEDENGCSMYLIEGSHKALLIDTGISDRKLKPMLQELTKKPLLLAVTHAHIDHMYHADEFDTVYMHRDEIKNWHTSLKLCRMLCWKMFCVKRKSYSIRNFIAIDEATEIDLGDIKIRVLHSPGHTPGSVTFVDEFHNALFVGDVVGSGSGAWMWMPACSSLKKYKAALALFLEKLEPYKNFELFGGHRMQGIATEENKDAYPLSIATITDMKILCQKMLLGEVKEENPRKIGIVKVSSYRYGQAAMVECKRKIR